MKPVLALQLEALLKLFRATAIEYVILGGVAVSLYGEPRFTYDIDIAGSIARLK